MTRPTNPIALALIGLLAAVTACTEDATPTAPRDIGSRPIAGAAAPDVAPTDALPIISNHFAFYRLFNPTQPSILEFEGPSIFSPPLVARLGTGNYSVSVPLMSDVSHPGEKEVVTVTTYGITTASCMVDWVSLSAQDALGVVDVCDDISTGARSDVEFSVLVVGKNSVGGTTAFARDLSPTVASLVPDPATSFTTGTGAMVINRTAVGVWNVRLGTGNPQGSTFLVSTPREGVLCGLGAFTNAGVRVRCFQRGGAAVDAPFAVLQLSGGRYVPGDHSGATVPAAFAFADKPAATAPYTPNTNFSHSDRGAITVIRSGTGDYQVVFDGFQNPFGDPETVQVTPFGSSYAACSVVSRTDAGAGTSRNVRVQCRNPGGALVNSRFTIAMLR